MPRIARVVIPGTPHHITQRGNRLEDVFFCDDDRQKYLELLHHYSQKKGLLIQAYCLMSNHVHLIAVPNTKQSLSAVLKPVHLMHTQHINLSRGLTGRLWQGRFFSCPMDDSHTISAVRYVERNPVRSGLVDSAEDWPWSSAPAHCGLSKDDILSDPCNLTSMMPQGQWKTWLQESWEGRHTTEVELIKECTRTGRPAENDAFIDNLEKNTGRSLRARGAGRPVRQNEGPILFS